MSDKIYVAMLLDATGSMGGQEQRVVDGVNKYFQELANDTEHKYKVCVNLFDSMRFDTWFEGRLKDVPVMQLKDYVVGALTPLRDAIVRTIKKAEAKAGKRRVYLIVDTDGLENASQEISQEQLTAELDRVKGLGWTVVFLGAGIDALQVAAQAASPVVAKTMNTRQYEKTARVSTYTLAAGQTISSATHTEGADTRFWNDEKEPPAA